MERQEKRHAPHYKMSFGSILFDVIKWLILIVFVIVTLYPVVNTLAVSFNDGLDTIKGGIYLLPRKFSMQNYLTVLRKDSLRIATMVTIARTVIGTITQLFVTAMLAYIVSRKEFVLRKFLTIIYVLTMYVNAGLIPGYLLIKNLGLLNSFWVYIVPGMVSAFNMIVIRTFMNGIPDSLAESAEVDGAGHMRIFMQIMLPLCKPVLATVALFIAVGQWNSWFDAMLYNSFNENLTTLQYELMKLLSSVSSQSGNVDALKNTGSMVTPMSVRAATTIVTAIPIVCLYPFLQRYFVSGLTIGGVKE
ncbi:carbohydrate ABC transporter permease [Anaerosporobacter faecicola]|uniref:carbohydrate ABC transporter permease n=1 Tax=Anaerosporobacter faecicola TaxID=2718714 RepID=UPI00143A8839|nr:carbohydrate ABC transporter permease [Anaerosporobacter faecicola]